MKELRTIKTFSWKTKSNEMAKFTIIENLKNNYLVYSAKVVGEETPFYQGIPSQEKEFYTGTTVMDDKARTLLYLNPERLEKDIKEYYGEKRLKSEI